MNRELRLAILKKFDTQADFSIAANIDESIISRVLRGRRTLSQKDAEIWIKILECNPDILNPVIRK